jgi:hypothetical protein
VFGSGAAQEDTAQPRRAVLTLASLGQRFEFADMRIFEANEYLLIFTRPDGHEALETDRVITSIWVFPMRIERGPKSHRVHFLSWGEVKA